MHALILFSALLFSLSTPITCFNIDLIHRDSPLSPFYNSSMTQSELLRNVAFRSMSRSKRFQLQTDVVPIASDGEYLMRIFIGTPPVETWAIVDTGSDLVWLQCLPCTMCYPQNDPLFDPRKSSTYKTVSCLSKPCTFLPQGQSGCGISKQCVYYYDYMDNVSYTRGELARDLINFGGQSENLIHYEPVFGCGHNNSGRLSKNEAGVVGLGNGPLSLVSQLGPEIGHKFSYCLVPYFSNSTGKLKLGEEATISGIGAVVTPLNTVPGAPIFYYILNLEGITIGERTVKISESENGNIVIDSGTTFTFLPSSFYNSVEALVKEAIGVEAVPNPPDPFKLCYSNKSDASNIINYYFPTFEVHFIRGASLSLKPSDNIFVPEDDDLLCFGMIPTDGVPVYGNVAQINFQVEYDLAARKVFFARADCTKL